MYNGVFTWVETRAKSELRVRLVPLNMLKLSSFTFYGRTWPLPRTLSLSLSVGGGGGGGQDDITIQTSTMTPLTCVDRPRCWRMGQWLQIHFILTTRALNNTGNEHRR